MSFRSVFFAGLLAAGLFGCGKQPEPRHIVILIDVSGSIERQALHQAFGAIDELVGHLHRGDWIAIIPILGDAEAEASGRIIRFAVPTNRRAYDTDLRNFRLKLKSSLSAMEAGALAHPGSKTDILGSVALAEQEFASVNGESTRLLLILSDFIQEDNETDFKIEKRLASPTIAKEFASQISRPNVNLRGGGVNLNGVSVYLGLLRSIDGVQLSHKRASAIQKFWVEYFRSSGSRPQFVFDGPGLMANSVFAQE